MELTQKKPIIFSNIQENDLYNIGNNVQTFLSRKVSITPENNSKDKDNFAYLLIQFIYWMKQYYNQIFIESIESNGFKIKIDNSIGEESVKFFLNLFEELSLFRLSLNYNDITNQWFCSINF